MKAKDLAAILLQTPEADVNIGFEEWHGGDEENTGYGVERRERIYCVYSNPDGLVLASDGSLLEQGKRVV